VFRTAMRDCAPFVAYLDRIAARAAAPDDRGPSGA
jgi:hypothetical protein